jgi:hypothetical protein
MISAKEALEIYNNSLYTLQRYLEDNFHSKIRQAAMDGKREYILYLGANEIYCGVPKLDVLQCKAITELGKLGFNVQYGFYGEEYVPRGLADDDGTGPIHRNFGIKVTW